MSNFNLTLSLARRFMEEVLDSVETISAIAETHGMRTVIYLMYLQNAIISESFIDEHGDSKVVEFLSSLPSANLWMAYVRSCPMLETIMARIPGEPALPLALQTGITVIDDQMTIEEAHERMGELEALYDTYFGEVENSWTWHDAHPLDHSAFVELQEVIRAGTKPPLDANLVSQFRTVEWRKPFSKVSEDQTTAAE